MAHGLGKLLAAAYLMILAAFGHAAEQSARCDAAQSTQAASAAVVQTLVVDSSTGGPIRGAIVAWTFRGNATSETKERARGGFSGAKGSDDTEDEQALLGSTDFSGRYSFQVPVLYRRDGQPVGLTIESNGYRTLVTSVRTCPGANLTVTLKLAPAKRFVTVQGRVTDAVTGIGIPNATVALLNHAFPQPGLSATTSADGSYVIRRVGPAPGLSLQVTTETPPCVAPTARSLDMRHGKTILVDFNLPQLLDGQLRCPKRLDGTGPTSPSGSGPSLPDDSGIQWQIASADSILLDDSIDAWNAGHINDIVKVGLTDALVAGETSGVWSLAWGSSDAATPLSTAWDSINVRALANGPDGFNHAYAGTESRASQSDFTPGGVLWETDTSSDFPFVTWRKTNGQPACGSIRSILVLRDVRRIVLGCDNGVWWSAIPLPPAVHGTYVWNQAIAGAGVDPSLLSGSFVSLAQGPGWGGPNEGTIVASTWGGALPSSLIFKGGWSIDGLTLYGATVQVPPGSTALIPYLGKTHVASCGSNPRVMYAVAADATNSALAAVWQSKDGGQNWSLVNSPPSFGTDGLGWYDGAIAVSPSPQAACNTFAIGWIGPNYVSFDGGNSYPLSIDNFTGADGHCCHLHADVHAMLFDPVDPATLWFATDGGLSAVSGVVPGGTLTAYSNYNRHMFNLQAYHASPSFHTPNLVVAPLQDNAVVWSLVPNAWQRVPGTGGDGAFTEFLGVQPTGGNPPASSDLLAWAVALPLGPWYQSTWDGSGFSSGSSTIPVQDSGNPRDPKGITGQYNWNVRSPSYSNSAGQLMSVVTGVNTNVYGLFANADGGDAHWELIGTIGAGENVNAISSFNGNVVLVGTDKGTICQLRQPYTGAPCLYFAIDQANAIQSINGLYATGLGSSAFAATGNNTGHVLSFDGLMWQAVNLPSDEPFFSVDGPDINSIFAASTTQVVVSHDLGATWFTASDGLPSVAHGTELHFVRQQDGNTYHSYMYLATYGWSMYRALLP